MLLEGSKLPLSKVATRVAVLLVALVEDDPSLASLIGEGSYGAAPEENGLRQLRG
jgi:hypothetical protein